MTQQETFESTFVEVVGRKCQKSLWWLLSSGIVIRDPGADNRDKAEDA